MFYISDLFFVLKAPSLINAISSLSTLFDSSLSLFIVIKFFVRFAPFNVIIPPDSCGQPHNNVIIPLFVVLFSQYTILVQ